MQRGSPSDPLFRATELLLQERVPNSVAIFRTPAEVSGIRANVAANGHGGARLHEPATRDPEVHLLSNGRYHVMVTNAAAATAAGRTSRSRAGAKTRRATAGAPSATCATSRAASSGRPRISRRRAPADHYEAIFSQGRAEFRRRDARARDPHRDRRLARGRHRAAAGHASPTAVAHAHGIELTSYAEVVLAPPAADVAHPAFSNLFVQTEIVRDEQAILVHAAAALGRRAAAVDDPPDGRARHRGRRRLRTRPTARAFIGRGNARGADRDASIGRRSPDSEGSVLDPIVAIRDRIDVEPAQRDATIDSSYGVAETREAAIALVEKYRDRQLADRVVELSWTHARSCCGSSTRRTPTRSSTSGSRARPVREPVAARARQPDRAEPPRPVGAVGVRHLRRPADRAGADRATSRTSSSCASSCRRTRTGGSRASPSISSIWNEDPSGYRQVLHDQIMGVIAAGARRSCSIGPAASSCAAASRSPRRTSVLMQTVARADRQRQRRHARRADRPAARAGGAHADAGARRASTGPTASPTHRPPQRPARRFNGLGGFTPDGREYVITTDAGPRDAGAVGQRAREPVLRHRRVARAAARTPGARTRTSSG